MLSEWFTDYGLVNARFVWFAKLYFSLFCRLAALLRIKNRAFGSVAKITVKCLQGLTQALDLRYSYCSYFLFKKKPCIEFIL